MTRRKACPITPSLSVTPQEAEICLAHMTAREREILAAYCRGGFYKVAASELGISSSTVETMLYKAKHYIGARSMTHLIVIAAKGGLV